MMSGRLCGVGDALRVGVDVAGGDRAGVRQAFRVPDKVSAVRDMIVLVAPLLDREDRLERFRPGSKPS